MGEMQCLSKVSEFLKTKTTAKLTWNIAHHGWVTKKIFTLDRLKSLTNISFTFLLYWNTQICILNYKTFMKKNSIKELHPKSFKNKLCGFQYKRRKGSSLLLKKLPKSKFWSTANYFTLKSIFHIKYSTFRKQSFH